MLKVRRSGRGVNPENSKVSKEFFRLSGGVNRYPFCPSDPHLRRIFFNICLKTMFFYVFSSKFIINLPKIADQLTFSDNPPPSYAHV